MIALESHPWSEVFFAGMFSLSMSAIHPEPGIGPVLRMMLLWFVIGCCALNWGVACAMSAREQPA
ncbi:hypothetical protein [Halocatena halophila]|uniref:hypothetical protein n=1 Tax=Halocatena halophila TaxID=2814576 RepID=UPI002ED29363